MAAPAHSPAAVALSDAPRSKRKRLQRAWERLSIGSATPTCLQELVWQRRKKLGLKEIDFFVVFLQNSDLA